MGHPEELRLVQPVKRGSVRRAIKRINAEVSIGAADWRRPSSAPEIHKAVVDGEFWRRDFESANAAYLRAISLLALASPTNRFVKEHSCGIVEIPPEICDAADIALCAECVPFDPQLLCEAMPVCGGVQ